MRSVYRSIGIGLSGLLALSLASTQPAPPAAGLTWGYVDNIDGQALTLDDGTTVKLGDATKVVRLDGTDGTPADVAKGLRAELTLDAQGTVTRLELLPTPLAPEAYLSNLTVRGAIGLRATVGGRTYPRSLAAIKATFVGQANMAALVGGVAFVPPKESKAGAARFAIVGPASDVLFECTVKAGESADFRLNFTPGRADAFTLLATPVGEGALQPEWCLWLDPRLVAPLPAPQGVGVLRSTAHALLADLRQALGDKQAGPLAIALFANLRVRDDQALQDLHEDLIVAAVGSFQVTGKCAQRPEPGVPLPDAAKAEAVKLGAKSLLVGSVSDRGDMLVINAVLVDVESGQIIATARATQ
jgi:TolB-like protein